MIYPCPPPSHISHSDSLAVCVAHPSGPTQRKERHMKTHGCFGAGGTALSCWGRDRVPEKCLPTWGWKNTKGEGAGETEVKENVCGILKGKKMDFLKGQSRDSHWQIKRWEKDSGQGGERVARSKIMTGRGTVLQMQLICFISSKRTLLNNKEHCICTESETFSG